MASLEGPGPWRAGIADGPVRLDDPVLFRPALPGLDQLLESLRLIGASGPAGRRLRPLHYAFKEHFGVTPKAYLTAIRLDAARRELVPRELVLKVADVANRWGFWHMGHFAADYRKQFGELPSETLRRPGAVDAGMTG